MAQDPMAKAEADYETVLTQMTALRDDLARLAQDMPALTLSRGQAMARGLSKGMSRTVGLLGRKGHAADMRLEGAIAANPYLALGIAAALGLVLGALIRRQSSPD